MDFLSKYFKYENGLTIAGLTKELNVFFVLELFKKENRRRGGIIWKNLML